MKRLNVDKEPPLTFHYRQVFADEISIRQQRNASTVSAIFYFQEEKIIYHFYGFLPDRQQTIILQNGFIVPNRTAVQGEVRGGEDRDCYLMFRNRLNNTRILSFCVLEWAPDQSTLIIASDTNRSLSALVSHLKYKPLVKDQLDRLSWPVPILPTVYGDYRTPDDEDTAYDNARTP